MRNYFLGITLLILPMSPVAFAAEGFSPAGCPLVSREQVSSATGGQGHTHWVVKINNIGVIVVAGAGTLEPQAEKIGRNLCKAVNEIHEQLKTQSQVKAFHIEDPERGSPTIQWGRVKIVTATKGDVDHYLNESGRDGLSCGLASRLRPLIELQMCVAEYWHQLLENGVFLTLNGEVPRYLVDFDQGRHLKELFDTTVSTYKRSIPSASHLNAMIQQSGKGQMLSSFPLSIPSGFRPLEKKTGPAMHESNWATLDLLVQDAKANTPIEAKVWLGEQDSGESAVRSPGKYQLIALAGEYTLRVEALPNANRYAYQPYKDKIALTRGLNEHVVPMKRLVDWWGLVVKIGGIPVLLAILGILLHIFGIKIRLKDFFLKIIKRGEFLRELFSSREFISIETSEIGPKLKPLKHNVEYPLWHEERDLGDKSLVAKYESGVFSIISRFGKEQTRMIYPGQPLTFAGFGGEKIIVTLVGERRKFLSQKIVYRFKAVPETISERKAQREDQPRRREAEPSPIPGKGGLGPL